MSRFTIRFEGDAVTRETIANNILRALPDWFGIEGAIVDYCESSTKLPMVVLYQDEEPIGFCSLKVNYAVNCDLVVLGILPQYHRQGLGERMIFFIEELCREKSIPYMSVKTLSERHPDEYYARTRKFYEKCGFIAFEEIPALWGEENPCLLMIKPILP
ncbi:MAG: GNAT family N-acetyltransferase [Anaerolineae bacterium]|jgi:ribosomal protein S18 acetylase RimI-like enzyme|nr:GNAT family N-acetyltransferase [Anaerolineae bacterium]